MYKRRDDILSYENPMEVLGIFYKEIANYLIDNSITQIDGDLAIDEKRLGELTKIHLGVYIEYPSGCFDGLELDEAKQKLSESFIDLLEKKQDPRFPKELFNIHRNRALTIFDLHWTEHIDAMDKFQKSVQYLSYEQKDPLNTYTNRGFKMFDDMNDKIALEIGRNTLNLTINIKFVDASEVENKRDVIDV
jgi:preprotein translocase subunit SecA